MVRLKKLLSHLVVHCQDMSGPPPGVRPVRAAAHGTRETVQQDASHARTHQRLGQHDTANPEGDRLAYPRRPAGQASGQASISHVRGSVTLGNKVFARMGAAFLESNVFSRADLIIS